MDPKSPQRLRVLSIALNSLSKSATETANAISRTVLEEDNGKKKELIESSSKLVDRFATDSLYLHHGIRSYLEDAVEDLEALKKEVEQPEAKKIPEAEVREKKQPAKKSKKEKKAKKNDNKDFKGTFADFDNASQRVFEMLLKSADKGCSMSDLFGKVCFFRGANKALLEDQLNGWIKEGTIVKNKDRYYVVGD